MSQGNIETLENLIIRFTTEFPDSNLAILRSVVPDDQQRYGKSSLSVDLQYLGYNFVRSIWSYDLDNKIVEDASYLVRSWKNYSTTEFLNDIDKLGKKYSYDSFILLDYRNHVSKEFSLSKDNVFHRISTSDYYDISNIIQLMHNKNNLDRTLIKSDFIRSVWKPNVRQYRLDHCRSEVFNKFGYVDEYDLPDNWVLTPWEL